jgi:hypothetical protein
VLQLPAMSVERVTEEASIVTQALANSVLGAREKEEPRAVLRSAIAVPSPLWNLNVVPGPNDAAVPETQQVLYIVVTKWYLRHSRFYM